MSFISRFYCIASTRLGPNSVLYIQGLPFYFSSLQIHEDIEAIAVCHQDMSERLKATRSVTTELVRQTTQLRANTKEVEMQSKVRCKVLVCVAVTCMVGPIGWLREGSNAGGRPPGRVCTER